jgi:ubiquinone/menaquinone biosynthesis C-methylase UbiE
MDMAGEATGYVGSIPEQYDRNLGPLLFTEYAADIAHRVAALNPRRVLETAAGTGIVTRALRDALPAAASSPVRACALRPQPRFLGSQISMTAPLIRLP